MYCRLFFAGQRRYPGSSATRKNEFEFYHHYSNYKRLKEKEQGIA
jgi:hypothetical protein